ncbi:MAG: hypothetical protein AB7H96_06175 [Vicinamibacterales bacterium]
MHEYIELRFRRNGKPLSLRRQIEAGFEFDEPHPVPRTIELGVAPFDDGTRYRMQRVRSIKGWGPQHFDLRASVEDGSLVLRGVDQYALPEGWYIVSASVSGTRRATVDRRRIEVKHDGHGVVTVDLTFDTRGIAVDLDGADGRILSVLQRSQIDGLSALDWVQSTGVRPTRRACALNILATLRVTPKKSEPLINDVVCLFEGRDDRTFAKVTPAFLTRVQQLAESSDLVYPEGRPKAKIHEQLLPALVAFAPDATGQFRPEDLLSFRVEGSPSLQMVIARPKAGSSYEHHFVDLDLDLGNPLQDIAGLVVHIGEVLDGKPTNHLDFCRSLGGKPTTGPFLYYDVTRA